MRVLAGCILAAGLLASSSAMAATKSIECKLPGKNVFADEFVYQITADFDAGTIKTAHRSNTEEFYWPVLPIGETFQILWSSPNNMRVVAHLIGKEEDGKVDFPVYLIDVDFSTSVLVMTTPGSEFLLVGSDKNAKCARLE